MYKKLASGFLAGVLVLFVSLSQAANPKIVLQISDGSPAKQDLVLNVAANVQKHYGVGNVDIEIVAFGPGLRLLFANNARADRIQSLSMNGVRFSACKNTIKKMTSLLGKPPKINRNAKNVDAGVVRIMTLTSQGYLLVRP